jgi:hypothetical protein
LLASYDFPAAHWDHLRTLNKAASKTPRRLNGTNRLPNVIEGVKPTASVADGDAARKLAAKGARHPPSAIARVPPQYINALSCRVG